MTFFASVLTAALVSVVVAAAVAFWRWRRRTFNFFKERGIPGPEPSLFSGNFDHLWNDNTCKVLQEWSKKYGDVYGIFIGDAPFLVVNDLELLRRVFVTDFAKFANRGDVWRLVEENPVIQHATSFADGDRWKLFRRPIAAAFSAAKLKPMLPEMAVHVDRFLDLIEGRSERASAGEVDVFPPLRALAFEVVAGVACGLQLDVLYKPSDEYFDDATSGTREFVQSPYHRISQFFSRMKGLVPFVRMVQRMCEGETLMRLINKVEAVVEHRLKNLKLSRPDVLQSLLDTRIPSELLDKHKILHRKNNEGDLMMHTTHVAGNAAVLLAAGVDTVACSTAFCIYCLAKYPEVQERVRKEVRQAYEKHGGFSFEAINDLSYTAQTISETLRLYTPVVGFIVRKASCDFRYKDLTLPKGVNILADTEHIHRDPNLWDRPEEFDPDRFSPDRKALMDPLAFQPYGIGPRNCVGMRLAQLEISLILAKLVHRFRLHLGSKHAQRELQRKTLSIAVSPKDGAWVRLEKL